MTLPILRRGETASDETQKTLIVHRVRVHTAFPCIAPEVCRRP